MVMVVEVAPSAMAPRARHQRHVPLRRRHAGERCALRLHWLHKQELGCSRLVMGHGWTSSDLQCVIQVCRRQLLARCIS